mmetsp:Transcript_52718/g.107543  ORF Transcript_52718/g.107543 Transcript_52718/m.107543 type:complete len:213 (-) Transcript_52718:42-680(-)
MCLISDMSVDEAVAQLYPECVHWHNDSCFKEDVGTKIDFVADDKPSVSVSELRFPDQGSCTMFPSWDAMGSVGHIFQHVGPDAAVASVSSPNVISSDLANKSSDSQVEREEATRPALGVPASGLSSRSAGRKQKKKLIAWTQEEHELFVKGLERFRTEETEAIGPDGKKTVGLGPGIAELLASMVGTRNPAQVRSHAQKYFLRVRKEMGEAS